MPKHASKLTCEEFQRDVADLINSGADPEDAERHPHAKACATCRQFLQDITFLSDAVQDLEWKSIFKPN